MKTKYSILLLFFLFIITSCNNNEVKFNTIRTNANEINSSTIIVDVKGAVMLPGVYVIPEGSLLIDVVELAGGLCDDANINNVNLVTPVNNNDMIVIPFNNKMDLSSSKININLASKEQLMQISGIGDAKAIAIVAFREENGFFQNIDDIKKVSGISEALFNKIKTTITIS